MIATTSSHPFWDATARRWVKAAALKYGAHLRTPGGGTATALGGWVPRARTGWMWDLTVTGDHDFYIQAATTAILVHNCNTAAEDAGSGAGTDPAAHRVNLRQSTRQAIQDAAPKTTEGDFIDPNTGQVIPKEGPFDYGHKPGYEWWRTQEMAREQGWTRQQVIEYENDPSHYQIEDPSSNRSGRYQLP